MSNIFAHSVSQFVAFVACKFSEAAAGVSQSPKEGGGAPKDGGGAPKEGGGTPKDGGGTPKEGGGA